LYFLHYLTIVDPIFNIIPIDIIKIIATPINIPDIVLYIDAKLDIIFNIFSSLHMGSHNAANKLYITLIEIIFITGINMTQITATIPIVPAYFAYYLCSTYNSFKTI